MRNAKISRLQLLVMILIIVVFAVSGTFGVVIAAGIFTKPDTTGSLTVPTAKFEPVLYNAQTNGSTVQNFKTAYNGNVYATISNPVTRCVLRMQYLATSGTFTVNSDVAPDINSATKGKFTKQLNGWYYYNGLVGGSESRAFFGTGTGFVGEILVEVMQFDGVPIVNHELNHKLTVASGFWYAWNDDLRNGGATAPDHWLSAEAAINGAKLEGSELIYGYDDSKTDYIGITEISGGTLEAAPNQGLFTTQPVVAPGKYYLNNIKNENGYLQIYSNSRLPMIIGLRVIAIDSHGSFYEKTATGGYKDINVIGGGNGSFKFSFSFKNPDDWISNALDTTDPTASDADFIYKYPVYPGDFIPSLASEIDILEVYRPQGYDDKDIYGRVMVIATTMSIATMFFDPTITKPTVSDAVFHERVLSGFDRSMICHQAWTNCIKSFY